MSTKNELPEIRGSKSFDGITPKLDEDNLDDAVAYKNRTYSLDSENLAAQEEIDLDEEEDEEDEEIRLAKEMALAIAQNPDMTPDQLREIQEKTKQKVAAAAASVSSKKKNKAVKAMRSSFKASMKAVSSVVHHKRPSTPSSTNDPASTSPTVAAVGTSIVSPRPTPSSQLDSSFVPPAISPMNTKDKTKGIAVSPRLSNFADSDTENMDIPNENVGNPMRESAHTSDFAGGSTPIRLTGIVWKRRSGLGKYSSTAAWERRRIVLQGTKLLYYKTSQDSRHSIDNDEASLVSADSGTEDLSAGLNPEPPTPTSGWLIGSIRNSTVSSGNAARGYLDLLKEKASVAASYGHTGAPTPFALSIKILGQTKWKLCFDTHEELMEWLAATTDIVVQGSVDTYNALILEAYDPRNLSAGISGGHLYGQLSEPPRNLSPQYSNTAEEAGGHRLWSTGHYNVKSNNYPEKALEEMEDELEEVNSDDDDLDVTLKKNVALDKEMEFIMDPATGKVIWGIPSQQLLPMVIILNLALCLSRSSAVSSDVFWHLITFTNIALLGVLSKESVGGTFISKSVMRSITPTGLPGVKMESKPGAVSGILSKADAKVMEIPKPNEDYKPQAGSTTMRIENPTDLPVKDGIIFGGWRNSDPTIMQIRSVGYKKHKNKVASPGELYKCIHVDIFESRTRYPDMASRVTLPKVDYDNDKGRKTWHSPDLFVITIAIPTDPPKLYGSADNGGGYTVTMYYQMHQETRDILRRVTADGYKAADEKKADDPNTSKVNAVRLLEEWCRRAPTDDNFMARFKVVPNAQNLKEIGLPSWIAKYNGKPFLIKRPGQTGFLYRHPEKSCIEFDISLHPFPYLAKQGICYMKDAYFKKVLVTFGFLIEGRSDDELPECLIGLFQLCYPDPQHAIQGEDFFAGKSPSSF